MRSAALLRGNAWGTVSVQGRALVKHRPIYSDYARRQFSSPNVVADQTKKNNSPTEGQDSAHDKTISNKNSTEDNPAKQADPQEPPTRSTGIEPSGPDGNAKDKE